MATIKNRLDNLPERDLEILLNEYGNYVEVERYGSALNVLIENRLMKYVDDKVSVINKGLEEKYDKVFDCVHELDELDQHLKVGNLSIEEKETSQKYRQGLIKGKAGLVASIREDYNRAKRWLSSGIHGFCENVRATESKMSYVGMRFAKDYPLDKELLKRQAALEQLEMNSIKKKDDENALRAFVESEALLYRNTKIENSFFGKRSVGKKWYSPLAEKLKYGQDPFVRDIFSTVAVFGALIALTSNFDGSRYQAEIDKVNAHNQKIAESVNHAGEIINSKRDVILEGMTAQTNQDVLNYGDVGTIEALNYSSSIYGGWSVGTDAYHDFREAVQTDFNSFYESTKSAITDITHQLESNQITNAEALNMLSEVSKNSQTSLASICSDSLPYLIKYANNHSQFDLTGVREAMNYIVNHPLAITDMNRSMIEITDLGDSLANLSIEQVSLLKQLPVNFRNAFFGAATATALAMYTSDKMHSNTQNGKYGNKVVQSLSKFLNKQDNLNQKIAVKRKTA